MCRPGTAIHLNEGLSDAAIECLLECGMKRAYPDAYKSYQQGIRKINTETENSKKEKVADIRKNVEADKAMLQKSVRAALLDHVVDAYPYVALWLYCSHIDIRP